jgi:hypothetical protein
MVPIALSVLAFAAGVYLLIKVEREFLGGIFKALAWAVILLSLISVGFSGYNAINCKRHCEQKCERSQSCHRGGTAKGECSYKQSSDCSKGATACGGACQIVGDSVILDKEKCTSMMGKNACDKINAERGQCIISKAECMKMCSEKGITCCAESSSKKECCKK